MDSDALVTLLRWDLLVPWKVLSLPERVTDRFVPLGFGSKSTVFRGRARKGATLSTGDFGTTEWTQKERDWIEEGEKDRELRCYRLPYDTQTGRPPPEKAAEGIVAWWADGAG